MTRRYYSSTATATTLTSGVSSGATSLPVAATTGWPTSYPFTLILDADTASEEVVSVTAVAGLNATVTRAADGTSAVSHATGATVQHGVSARDFDEPNSHVNTTTGAHGLDSSLWTAGLGAWSSWTPTFAGFTLGNGTATAKYSQVGKIVNWTLTLTCGSTSASTATTATFTLPVTAARASAGSGFIAAYKTGAVVNCTTTVAEPVITGGGTSMLGTSSGLVADGIVFTFSGTFEAA